ncbi:MAG: RsmE family RNA methyltransferase, partial [Deltaproteobacteria bacterium]|nr:RsmE family RNA methyltransferase [Deltaproteobacteria bacterium]
MARKRIVVDGIPFDNGKVTLTGEHYNYLANVLRMRKGARFEIQEKGGAVHSCVVDFVGKGFLTAEISGVYKDASREVHGTIPEITLLCAIMKGRKFPLIIQKAVELGAARIVPLLTERTVPRLSDPEEKAGRWKKIAYAAVQQCGRRTCPDVLAPVAPGEAVKLAAGGLKLLLYEKGKTPLKDVLNGIVEFPENIAVAIGPEGGFAAGEA